MKAPIESIYILPYIEQGSIFNKLTFNGDSGWTNDQTQVSGSTLRQRLNNVTLIKNAGLKLYRCPSDPKPDLIRNDSNVHDSSGNESALVNRNSYVAIRWGTSISSIGAGLFLEYPEHNQLEDWSWQFEASPPGAKVILPELLKAIKIASVTDGLPATPCLSPSSPIQLRAIDQSGHLVNDQYSVTSTGGGLFRGHSNGTTNGTVSAPSAGMDARGQTYTTIRYKINQKNGWTCGGANGIGVCGGGSGYWNSEGANVPLISAHTGGVNALYGDGSVHFLSDATDLLTLAQLATRDDGGVMTNLP